MEIVSGLTRITRALDVLMTWTCVAALAILGVYASDRDPPFAVISADVPTAAPGEDVTIRAMVWRDRSRHCSATLHRSVYHSDGLRTDLAPRFFSAADIDRQERETPGRMAPTFRVPDTAVPGRTAYLSSTILYECNQAHRWFEPIEVVTVLPFNVRAP